MSIGGARQMDEDLLERLKPDQYWNIRTSQVEGHFLIQKLVTKFYPKLEQKDEDVVMGFMTDGTVTYWLRKKALSAEDLSKAIGYPLAKLLEAKVIKLTVPQRDDLPKPTVSYWGEA